MCTAAASNTGEASAATSAAAAAAPKAPDAAADGDVPPRPPASPKPCNAFKTTGHCKFGDKCKYLHTPIPDAEQQPAVAPGPSSQQQPAAAAPKAGQKQDKQKGGKSKNKQQGRQSTEDAALPLSTSKKGKGASKADDSER